MQILWWQFLCQIKKQLRKLTKNYNIKAVDIPVEINPMKMTSETLEWFAYYLGIT